MPFLLSLALGARNWLKIAGGALKRFFLALSLQGWCGLIGCLVLAYIALHQWSDARHWKKQSGQFEKLYRADEASFQRIADQATALKLKTDTLNVKITSALKERHNEEVARNAADAAALRVSGPGKAACPGNPGPAAAASGHVQAAAVSDVAGPPLLAGDRAAVPWDWLIGRAQEHDDLLSEVKTWRDDDAQLRKAWPKSTK